MPPVSALVDFLRTFGPVATSDSLCDENLRQMQATFDVVPIDTPAPRAADLQDAILGAAPSNVVLTGTAGDGKTYHVRKFFMSTFPERADEWPGEDGILSLPLPDGRELRVIRDLSEISDSEKASELAAFTAALLGETPERTYLVAANDGQLLKYFRDAATQPGPDAARAQTLHQRLSEMLREEREGRPDLDLRLLNLSRTWSEAVVDAIFDAVLEHPDWDSDCEKCPALEASNACPIRLNRSLLRNGGAEATFRTRLKDALRLAAANDQHIPIRQLLTLVVNIILGDASRPDDPLLDCATARARAQARRYAPTNPYNNAVGLNLRPERRRANRVFNVFEVLAVGFETNNLIDSSLVQRQPAELYEALFSDDPIYGRDLFEPLRDAYFMSGGAGAGPAADAVIRDFRKGLEAQRRRAFFRLPTEGQREMASPWRLSIFQHGGEYLKLLDALLSGASREIVDPYTRQLLRGLNRAFTGMMTIDDERLWLAGTIGKTDDPAGRIATLEPIDRTSATSFNVRLALDPVGKRPCLRVMPPRLAPQTTVSELALRPLLFEYLMRVASGSLPSSFSRQCHQEIRHFALVTQTAVQRLMASDEDQTQVVRILALGSRGEVQAQPLEV